MRQTIKYPHHQTTACLMLFVTPPKTYDEYEQTNNTAATRMRHVNDNVGIHATTILSLSLGHTHSLSPTGSSENGGQG